MKKGLFFLCIYISIFFIDTVIPKDSLFRIENSYYESLQYVVLLYGFYLSWKDLTDSNNQIKGLGLSGILLWLVVLGREINWGRVYFLYDNFYKYTVAYPLVTFSIIFSLVNMIKYKIFQKTFRFIWQGKISAFLVFTLIMFALGHYIGEKIIDSSFVEMTMELFCYTNLVVVVNQVRNALKN